MGPSTPPADTDLPRLLYVGDVPVEATSYGSVFFFRLFDGYAPERLQILETDRLSSVGARLPSVNYRSIGARWPVNRAVRSRFADWAIPVALAEAELRGRDAANTYRSWRPDVVVTVAHGYGWRAARAVSRRLGSPLVLTCHDDWFDLASARIPFQRFLARSFAQTYVSAAARLCICPEMENASHSRYGVGGRVLYPLRDRTVAGYSEVADRVRTPLEQPTLAFIGSIWHYDVVDSLTTAAQILQELQGRLAIFSGNDLRARGSELARMSNVDFHGFVPRLRDVVSWCRDNADIMFLPMSFDPKDLSGLSFPSKLTDYTAIGLPILMLVPPGSPAHGWASRHTDVVELVSRQAPADLRAALARLVHDPARRWALASRALAAGELDFAHNQVQRNFIASLQEAIAGGGRRSADPQGDLGKAPSRA